jgi:hypothetical protein
MVVRFKERSNRLRGSSDIGNLRSKQDVVALDIGGNCFHLLPSLLARLHFLSPHLGREGMDPLASKENPVMNNKHLHEIRLGSVKAAVWMNSSATGTWHLVTFGRLYKDADKSWKTTDSFGRDDLPLVEKIADLVPRWIHANGRQEPVNE